MEFDPQINLGGLFESEDGELNSCETQSCEKCIRICNMDLQIQEYSFSATNANFVWPHNEATLTALLSFKPDGICELDRNAHIVELGSGTGVLTIALRKLGFTSAVTSDFDCVDIATNIERNCQRNDVYHAHVPHVWGDPFPWPQLHSIWRERLSLSTEEPSVILVASDILLYKKLYSNLVKTICQLLTQSEYRDNCCVTVGRPKSYMILGAKRRVNGDYEFFDLLHEASFEVNHLGGRLYHIQYKALVE